MRRVLLVVWYMMLALVILSEAHTVWVAAGDPQLFQRALPGASGGWRWVAAATSSAAGLNAILVGLRVRWAIWLNILIACWSIVLVHLVGGAPINGLIIAIACLVAVGIPMATWVREPEFNDLGKRR